MNLDTCFLGFLGQSAFQGAAYSSLCVPRIQSSHALLDKGSQRLWNSSFALWETWPEPPSCVHGGKRGAGQPHHTSVKGHAHPSLTLAFSKTGSWRQAAAVVISPLGRCYIFIIAAGSMQVKPLPTCFNMRAYRLEVAK